MGRPLQLIPWKTRRSASIKNSSLLVIFTIHNTGVIGNTITHNVAVPYLHRKPIMASTQNPEYHRKTSMQLATTRP